MKKVSINYLIIPHQQILFILTPLNQELSFETVVTIRIKIIDKKNKIKYWLLPVKVN
jgi:hypothetical protein